MRDSIARAVLWVLRRLLPARGKRRAVSVAPPVTGDGSANAWSRPWRGPSAVDARAIFHAEETRGLTPDQRERWWAAAFSEIGVDYDFPTVNITGVRTSWQEAAA